MEIWQQLGALHPKLVMFPLVLLLAGLLFDLGGVIARSARAHWAGMICAGAGTVGLLLAFVCGIYAEIWAGRSGVPQHPMELHELMANVAAWGFVVLFAWRIFLAEMVDGMPVRKNTWMRAYVCAGLLLYVVLALTGWLGGKLVFEYGAAVGNGGSSVLSMADLNTLGARQTDENLVYSEKMHHIFGGLTLVFAASLLAQALWPRQAKKLNWIVPVGLLFGGVYLFCYADSDLYAFTDPRQWRDREVQLHKTLATIMVLVGAAGLWRLWKFRAKATADETGAASPFALGSKLIAVMALIGGAMLFTHVHSVAPYANVAAGVYIAHVVLGVTALLIGAARWAQDFIPTRKRELALAFAGLMAIEAMLLITYNEGLPWFIGYGSYDRWGPDKDRHVVIAPFGNFRAAMYVDEQAGNFFVAFRPRWGDDSVKRTMDSAPVLVVAHGNGEVTAVPLKKSVLRDAPPPLGEGEFEGVNFQGHAEFLKGTPWLSAKLVLHENGRERIGYFDPWVLPMIPVIPPNETAAFECPMHEGMRWTAKANCPICGMEMQPIRAPRAGTGDALLHDAGYGMTLVRADDSALAPGAAAEFLLTLTKDARGIGALAIVHEQPVHLIVASSDLKFFDHVHPLPMGGGPGQEGAFRWKYTFPKVGTYEVFAEFTPRGDRAQITRAVVKVGTGDVINARLAADVVWSKVMQAVPAGKTPQDSAAWVEGAAIGNEGIAAEMTAQPRTIYAGLHTDLVFRLADASGKPVTDLEPYLGAMGHLVAMSEDGTLMHAHPVQWSAMENAGGGGGGGGPVVAFHGTFPSAGKWRVWGQFKRSGRIVMAEFVVDVKEPLIPAGLVRWLLGD